MAEKKIAALVVEIVPCHHKVARRIARAHGAEIDDAAQSAVLRKQIAYRHVAVNPERRRIESWAVIEFSFDSHVNEEVCPSIALNPTERM